MSRTAPTSVAPISSSQSGAYHDTARSRHLCSLRRALRSLPQCVSRDAGTGRTAVERLPGTEPVRPAHGVRNVWRPAYSVTGTEVATRCLKAVRRQKFNYHRRARPEALGGRLTLACLGAADRLGCAGDGFEAMLEEIPAPLRKAIVHHNAEQNAAAMERMRRVNCKGACRPDAAKSAQRIQGLQPAAADGVPGRLANASGVRCRARDGGRRVRHDAESVLRDVHRLQQLRGAPAG